MYFKPISAKNVQQRAKSIVQGDTNKKDTVFATELANENLVTFERFKCDISRWGSTDIYELVKNLTESSEMTRLFN